MNEAEIVPPYTVTEEELRTQTFDDTTTTFYPIDTLGWLKLIQESNVLDFWDDPREDVYSDG